MRLQSACLRLKSSIVAHHQVLGLLLGVLAVNANDLNRVWLLAEDSLTRDLGQNHRLLQLDLLLEQVLYLLDIIDVIFVDRQVALFHLRCSLLLDLLEQLLLVGKPFGLLGFLQPLLGLPVLLVRSQIISHLRLLLVLLDLTDVLPLINLFHQIVL